MTIEHFLLKVNDRIVVHRDIQTLFLYARQNIIVVYNRPLIWRNTKSKVPFAAQQTLLKAIGHIAKKTLEDPSMNDNFFHIY